MEPQKQFEYAGSQPVELHKIIKALLVSSKTSKPYFPALWSKKLSQQAGLQCNQDVFFNLMSNVVDYKLEQMMTNIKQNKISIASTKKQTKQMMLKTSDVEKYFDNINLQICRPRIYPQFQVNENQDDAIMPMSDQQK